MATPVAAAFVGGFAIAILFVVVVLGAFPWLESARASSLQFSSGSIGALLDQAQGPVWESINAITLGTPDMNASLDFYERLGLVTTYGGQGANFSTVGLGGDDNTLHVNLFLDEGLGPVYSVCTELQAWGRYIVYVSDVDAMHERAVLRGLAPEFEPRNGPWGERYFHIRDPGGHEVSFAQRIAQPRGCGDDPHCYGLLVAGVAVLLTLWSLLLLAWLHLRRRRSPGAALESGAPAPLASSLQPLEAGGGRAG